MIAVDAVHHITLLCAPRRLEEVSGFYQRVLGLQAGPRPEFDFAGAWLYAGSEPIVHLAAVLPQENAGHATATSPPTVLPGAAGAADAIDHIAVRVSSTAAECRERLTAQGVRYTEAPVPGMPIHQIFFRDPLGVKIELNLVVKS